jgi:hypothetical protein
MHYAAGCSTVYWCSRKYELIVTEHKDEEEGGGRRGENEMRTRRWRRIRVTLRIIARKLLVDRDVCLSETKAIIAASFRSWATI